MQKYVCYFLRRNCKPQGRTSFLISQLKSYETTTAFPAAIAAGRGGAGAGGYPLRRCSPLPPAPWFRREKLGHPIKHPGRKDLRGSYSEIEGRGKFRGCTASWETAWKTPACLAERLSPAFGHELCIILIFTLHLPTEFAL